MNESRPASDPDWHDPDDAPELTDEIASAAEYAVGGKVLRHATGVLTAFGVRSRRPGKVEVKAETRPRGVVGVYAQARGGMRAMADKGGSGKRELIETKGDKRYVRRDEAGRFTESDDVGRSLSQDVRQRAKTTVKPGYGDKGDQKRKK